MTVTGQWNWDVTVPETWIPVDVTLPAADRRGELVAAIEALARDSAELAPAAPGLVDLAHNVVSHAVENEALFVAVGFVPLGIDVVTMAVAGYGLFGQHPPDLELLVEELRQPHERDLDGRDVQLVQLPAGPAARVHVISADGPPDETGKVVYVERVDYFIPVPGGTDMLLVNCTTPSIAVGEMVTELFDGIANTVALEPG
jgi:hypothetical protein